MLRSPDPSGGEDTGRFPLALPTVEESMATFAAAGDCGPQPAVEERFDEYRRTEG